MERCYIANIEHGGGFGNGYGGTYISDFEFISEHRANSKKNKQDAEKEWKIKHGNKGWVNIIRTYLA